MKETLSKKETPIIIGAGVIIGIIAVALVYFGNPANMAFVSPASCVILQEHWDFTMQRRYSTYVRKLWDWYLVPVFWHWLPKNLSQEEVPPLLHVS